MDLILIQNGPLNHKYKVLKGPNYYDPTDGLKVTSLLFVLLAKIVVLSVPFLSNPHKNESKNGMLT